MDEASIAQQLQQTIQPVLTPVTAPTAAPVTDTNQATTPVSYDLDDMVQYKLHDFFGEQYKPTDETSKQQVQYIYEQVAKMVEEKEYGFIVAKIRDLELTLGISQLEGKKYRLYQWLKLDSIRKNIDSEMGALTNG